MVARARRCTPRSRVGPRTPAAPRWPPSARWPPGRRTRRRTPARSRRCWPGCCAATRAGASDHDEAHRLLDRRRDRTDRHSPGTRPRRSPWHADRAAGAAGPAGPARSTAPSDPDPAAGLPAELAAPDRAAGDRADAPPSQADPTPGGPSSGEVAAGGPASAARRTARGAAALAATALLVAVAAGVGSALAITGDDPPGTASGPGNAGPQDRPPGYPPGQPDGPDGPGPDRPRPPPGRDVPPPPFPCVRPHVAGQPVPAGSPAPGERFRPPAGWTWHADTAGFRVAVPASWRYSREGEVACFQDPATGRALSVAEGGAAAPLARLRVARDGAARAESLPGYDEIRLAADGAGAEWECRWTAPYGARLHARQQVPDSPAGAAGWTLGWITTDADWAPPGRTGRRCGTASGHRADRNRPVAGPDGEG